MPRLNSLGEWCSGIGGAGAYWGTGSGTGTTVWTAAGSGTDWLNDDVLIAQHCPGACVVKSFNVRTSAELIVSSVGANNVSAGGGVWAAWLGGGMGLYSSTGLHKPASYLGHVGPDGAIAVKRLYDSFGPWDVYETSGAVWLLTTGDAQQIQLLGAHRAVWTEANQPRTIGCPLPNPITRPFYWLKMLPPVDDADPDGWWCLYQTVDGRLLLHPVLSLSGYQLLPTGSLAYYPDLVRLTPTTIKIVWATNEGEIPSSVVVTTINTTTTRTVFGTGLIVPPIAVFADPAYLGYFPYATSGGAAPGGFAGQNCHIDFTPHSGVFDNTGTKILSFVDTEYDMSPAGGSKTIEESINAQPTPRFVYWKDRFTRTPPPAGYWSTMGPRDIPACPLYRDAGESDAALLSSGTAQLAEAAAHEFKAVIVGGVWNRNNTLANQIVLNGGPIYRQLLDNTSCAGLFFFGIGRGATATPPQFVPEFQQLVDEFRVNGESGGGGPGGGGGGPGGGGGGGGVPPVIGTAILRTDLAASRRPPRQYPHVDGITDWRAKQSVRLLWDRHADLSEQLTAAHATITELQATAASQDDLAAVRRAAGEALALAQRTARDSGGGGTGTGTTDNGMGAVGCAAHGLTGHVDPTLPKTPETAGKIVCGVGAEFPALMAPTADKATRDAHREELLERIMWHLNQQGFPCQRYGTEGGRPWHLIFDALGPDGDLPVRGYCYRVTDYDPPYEPPTIPWDTTHTMITIMNFNPDTGPPITAAGSEPGLAD